MVLNEINQIWTLGEEQFCEEDARNLLNIMQLTPLHTVVEIGTWTGHSACVMGKEVQRFKGRQFCIDNFMGTGSVLSDKGFSPAEVFATLDKNLQMHGLVDTVTVLWQDSVEAARHFQDKSVDLLFIDGDHRYSGISRDIEAWLPKVRGIICGHDFDCYTYLEDALEQDVVMYQGRLCHHGVTKAVTEMVPGFNVAGRIWWKDISR